MDKDKKTKSKILIALLILITVCCIAITVWAVLFRNNTETVLSPDRAPQKIEENAEEIENDSTEKMKAEEGGGAVSITYSNEVTIDLDNKTAKLLFAIHQNPRRTW